MRWMDGLQADFEPDMIATMKASAFSAMQRGIGQFGIPVREGSLGYFHVDVVDRPSHVPRGQPPGAILLGFAGEALSAEVYYDKTRSIVRALLPASSQNGHAFAEAMGTAVGFVAVHEWGHLAVNHDGGYHDAFDPTVYNTEGVDSGTPGILGNNLIYGTGHWPKNIEDQIKRNLAQ